MTSKLTLVDLAHTAKSILNQKKTTVAFDTNTFIPFSDAKIPGLDLSRLPGLTINGYDLPALIIYQRMYSKEAMKIARYIQASNRAYIDLLADLFHDHTNLVMPIQVHRELVKWINASSLDEYTLWEKGDRQPFHNDMVNTLLRIRDRESYFEPIFRVQHEYKRAVKQFIDRIRPYQLVNHEGHDKYSEVLHQVSCVKVNQADMKLFGNTYVATHIREDRILKLISFDGGIHRIAKACNPKALGDNINIHVHKGYGFVKYRKAKGFISVRFDQTFPVTNYKVG